MKSALTFTILLLTLAAPVFAAATQDFSSYDVIITRKPFGEIVIPPPPSVTNGPGALPPQESYLKKIKVVGLTRGPSGDKVGLVDISTSNPQKYYLLSVGDSQDSLEVLQIDFEKEGALVRRGPDQMWIPMNENSQAFSNGGAGPTAAQIVEARKASGSSAVAVPRPPLVMSERVRRKLEIQEQKRKEAEAGPTMKGEELEKHLRQYQIELIKAQGELGPALPLQLTPEEDEQLVKDGYLPAQE